MINWRNGETVLLKVRAKVLRYNPSNKIIERTRNFIMKVGAGVRTCGKC